MRTPYRQQGMSALSMLIVLLVAVFFGTCVVKLAPVYIQSLTVKRTVETVVEEAKAGTIAASEIKGKLSKLFQVNMVDVMDFKEVKIFRENGITTVDARYEDRVQLMFNIDVVVKFDNLLYNFTTDNKKQRG